LRSALAFLRQLHLYLGVFCAPAILFFAFTGALQSFGLNDRSPDGSYVPPHWLSVLAQIHKKQSADLPQRRPSPPANAAAAQKPPGSAKRVEAVFSASGPQFPHNPLPERIFFLLVAMSLVATTFSGLWMSWKYKRKPALLAGLFAAGAIIPLILLKL
jgi:hypothetical protein